MDTMTKQSVRMMVPDAAGIIAEGSLTAAGAVRAAG